MTRDEARRIVKEIEKDIKAMQEDGMDVINEYDVIEYHVMKLELPTHGLETCTT